MSKDKDKKTEANLWIQALQPPSEPGEKQEAAFFSYPDTPLGHLVEDTLAAAAGGADRLDELEKRKNRNNPNIEYGVHTWEEDSKEDRSRVVTRTKKDGSRLAIRVTDIDLVTGIRSQAMKFFMLALMKVSTQAFRGGELWQKHITFTAKELMEIGMYTTRKGAVYGIDKGIQILKAIEITGKAVIDGHEVDAFIPIFGARFRIDKKTIAVKLLEDGVNWHEFMEFYTYLPIYFFKLSNRASLLVGHIFFMARQNIYDIATKGCFLISYRKIQEKLGLPNEKGTTNPKRDFKDVIDNVLEEIEELHSSHYHNTDFQLLQLYKGSPYIPPNLDITDYLDNCRLQVTLKGAFAERFIRIYKNLPKGALKQQITTRKQKKQ